MPPVSGIKDRLPAGTVVPLAIGLALLFGLPQVVDLFTLLQVTLYVIMAILALSLGFIWGYGGILCLGQSAFFGLGAYAYAIVAINLGDSTVAILLSLLLPAAFAAAFGYFMFYGRVSGVYVGVMTLTLVFILFNAINSTASPEYHIGKAPLGGYNGLPNVPGFNLPFDPQAGLDPQGMYYAAMGLLLAVYFGLKYLLSTRFGRVVVAIRENERRVEFIGFDVRLHKLLAFTLGGALAGLAGSLFVSWGNYVSPVIFSMIESAQITIWIMVGGTGTLLGPILGAVALSWLTAEIGTQQLFDANLLFGAILIVFVIFVPRGLLPLWTERAWSRLSRLRPAQSLPPNVAAPKSTA